MVVENKKEKLTLHCDSGTPSKLDVKDSHELRNEGVSKRGSRAEQASEGPMCEDERTWF